MSKRIALKDYVEVDGTDLSSFARSVTFSSVHNRVDASGFNSTGADEFLAGSTDQSLTVEFFDSIEVENVILHLHANRDIFPIVWRRDSSLPVSATNPELHGNVQAFEYSPSSTRGDVATYSVPFSAADSSGLYFVES